MFSVVDGNRVGRHRLKAPHPNPDAMTFGLKNSPWRGCGTPGTSGLLRSHPLLGRGMSALSRTADASRGAASVRATPGCPHPAIRIQCVLTRQLRMQFWGLVRGRGGSETIRLRACTGLQSAFPEVPTEVGVPRNGCAASAVVH